MQLRWWCWGRQVAVEVLRPLQQLALTAPLLLHIWFSNSPLKISASCRNSSGFLNIKIQDNNNNKNLWDFILYCSTADYKPHYVDIWDPNPLSQHRRKTVSFLPLLFSYWRAPAAWQWAAAGVHLGEVGVELEQPRPPGPVRSRPAPAAELFLALTLFGNYTERWPLDNWKYSNDVRREWIETNNIYKSLPCWLFLLMTLALDTDDAAALA